MYKFVASVTIPLTTATETTLVYQSVPDTQINTTAYMQLVTGSPGGVVIKLQT